MRQVPVALCVLVLAVVAAPDVRAAESYDACKYTITTLPTTLTTQGVWCLKADLATAIETGPAISVDANNVTLDCNGFKVGGLAAGDDTGATGIQTNGSSNLTVRNCNVRGFFYGINDVGSSGLLVEDNLFEASYYMAIYSQSSGVTIRRNRVLDTGASAYSIPAYAMYVHYDADILDNLVSGVYGSGLSDADAYGIYTHTGSGIVSGNRVRGLEPLGVGGRYYLYNSNSGRMAIEDNVVSGVLSAGDYGIRCFNANGVARDNTLLGFAAGDAVVNCAGSGNYVDSD